jgi:hypothetical protein
LGYRYNDRRSSSIFIRDVVTIPTMEKGKQTLTSIGEWLYLKKLVSKKFLKFEVDDTEGK